MKGFNLFCLFVFLCAVINATANSSYNQDSLQIIEDYKKGVNYYRGGLFDSAIFYLNKSDSLAQKRQNSFRHFRAQFGIASCWIARGEYSQADEIYRDALLNISQEEEQSKELLAMAYQGLGLIQYYLQNFDKSIYHYTNTKNIRESYFGVEHIETAKIYANIGLVFELLSMYDSSIYYQKKATQIFRNSVGEDHLYVGRMYYNMANSYNEKGEFLQAVTLVQNAITIREKHHGKYHFQVARAYERLGDIYNIQSLFSKANECFSKGVQIREQLNIKEESRDLGALYQRLALTSAYNNDFEKAFSYIDKGQRILAKSIGTDNPEYLIGEMIYGDIYFEGSNFKKAIDHYSTYISEYEKRKLNYNYSFIEAHYDKGIALSFLKEYEASNMVLRRCLKILEMPESDSTVNYSAPVLALKVCSVISNNYLKMNQFDKALESIVFSERVIEKVRSYFVNKGDIEDVNKIWNDNNQLGVRICHSLYNETKSSEFLKQMFEYINKNKGALINAKLNDALAKKTFEIPDSVRLREQNLIALFASKRSELHSVSKGESLVALEEINSIQFELEEIQHYYKLNNPDYYLSKTKNEYLSLDEYQESLTKNELSLHLHFSDSLYYLLMVSNDKIKTHVSSSDKALMMIDSLRGLIMNKESSIDPISSQLYNLLFAPVDDMIQDYSYLKIFSDGKLNYLPLEILIDGQGDYLFTQHQMSYAISPELLRRAKNKTLDGNRNELLSFAPEFGVDNLFASLDVVRGELASIPGAFEEVNLLQKIFSGEAFTSKAATESNFKKTADKYGMIHMATHAVVDDEYPDKSRLVFNINNDSINDGYLHAYEIYNLDLNAQLVTLSACNTGFGHIKKGEGVMSLSRAFAYAGVPATVVSLWPASDKSTPELMKHFYQNLKDGQAKDVALNNARKQYLETAMGKARHPFYWGGFVLIGDNSPIVQKANWWLWLSLATVLLIVIAVYRRKQSV